jgi:hypothetical protein
VPNGPKNKHRREAMMDDTAKARSQEALEWQQFEREALRANDPKVSYPLLMQLIAKGNYHAIEFKRDLDTQGPSIHGSLAKASFHGGAVQGQGGQKSLNYSGFHKAN